MNRSVTNRPTLSVIMPCYNAEKFLKHSIESVLNQTFTDFEFIIVNDGSTDRSLDIIRQYQKISNKIVVINREKNLGLTKSLKEALLVAKGKYIARMDADDICLPRRFEKQLRYMHEQKLDVCGSYITIFNRNIFSRRTIDYPVKHEDIVFVLLMNSCIPHPSVIFNREVFDYVNYDEDYNFSQDYKLWCDIIITKRFRLGNIPQVLLFYRESQNQISVKKAKLQRDLSKKIRLSYAKNLGEEEFNLVKEIVNLEDSEKAEDFLKIVELIQKFGKTKKLSNSAIYYMLRSAYNNFSIKNPTIYLNYLKGSKFIGMLRNIKYEAILCAKSILSKAVIEKVKGFK